MARKYDLISELYNRTCKTVVSNPQNWQAFLASACRNYKLRYDEQLLVYAQRPDATAVLEIEQWNKIFGRWVNRGARGIAVFADENRSRQRLTHYFDISDTHESRYSRTVPIWDMRQEYEADVIETLESTFGEIENKSSLAEAIMGAARNAAEDNIPDYLQDLYYATEGSSFEEVEEDIVAFIYKNVVTNSVAYMMMSRLGVDTDGYFELDDFRDVTNFNTQETLNALGFATSDIAEMGLTEISKTITALNRQNRIIVGQDRNEYNKVENNDERSLDNERTDLHDGGRLQPSEPETSTAARSDVGQIRSDEERVSEGTSQSPLLQSPDEGRTDTALGGSGTESQQDGGNNSEPDGTERGSDRTDESGGYDEMGSSDELPSQFGTGNRESGSDIRLEYYDRTHEDKSLPFFGRDEVINEILRTTPHLSASLEEIKDYYERNPDNKDRTEYIKSIFNNDYTELTLEDGRTVGYKTFENVLHLWEGKYDSRTAQSFYDWAVIARHFEAMRLLGELSDSIKPLPSMDGQMTFILDGRAEEKKTSAFTFSQEIIDAVLANGSGFSDGKMRIYEQFEKSLSAKENADFLKNEYGWGGSYPVIIGAGIDESHDGKGITITKGIGKENPHITLSWSQVEKRIGELIRTDRYLNSKEKEHYPQWLESQEERRAKIEETKRNREILSNAPPEQEVELAEKEPEEAEQLQDGEEAGTAGYGYRLEAIRIQLVTKGDKAPELIGTIKEAMKARLVGYQTHVQDYGTQAYVYDGAMAGTEGECKRMESIRMKLPSSVNSSIQYRSHVQDIGWEKKWASNGSLSGTEGQCKRLEAIQIKLSGDVAENYDVYYRVHVQDYGWLAWAKNGESSGTEGYAKRLEAIEVRLVPKGTTPNLPASANEKAFIKK